MVKQKLRKHAIPQFFVPFTAKYRGKFAFQSHWVEIRRQTFLKANGMLFDDARDYVNYRHVEFSRSGAFSSLTVQHCVVPGV